MNVIRHHSKLAVPLLVVVMALLSFALVHAQESTDTFDAPGAPISEEAAAAFAERFDAMFDEPNLDIADEIFAPEFVSHLPLAPELDLEAFKAYVASFYDAISDMTQEVNQVIVAEDRLILHVTYNGTHDGPLFGIPATGNPVSINGIGIFRFDENGMAVENWAVIDVVGLLAQIGAFPPAPAE
jgi:predicted ester cyclase